MNFFPVIARELLVAGRRPATYRQRILAAAAALAITVFILMCSGGFNNPGTLSKRIFLTISLLGFVYALLAGVFLTTDCICTERQEGTLPLLFLTHLNGFDVALGKLVSTSAVAGYALLAILPILGLPTLMGGVTGAEFARVCLVMVVTLLWSLTTGLLCSTLCRDTRKAVGTALTIALLSCLGFGLAWALGIFSYRFAQTAVLTPAGALLNSFDAYYRTQTGAGRYWLSIEILLAWAAVQFAVVSLVLRRYQIESPVGNEAPTLSRRRMSPRPMPGNPYFWLLERERFPTAPAIILASLLLLGFTAACLALGLNGSNRAGGVFALCAMWGALAFHWFVKGLVALHASRLMADQRQSGALELLLTTPLSTGAILFAHRKAKAVQLGGLVVSGALVNMVLFLALCSVSHMRGESMLLFFSFCLGGAVLLPLDCTALRWIALHEALVGKRHSRAVLAAFLGVFPLTWVAFFLGILALIGIRLSEEGVAFFYGVWAIICGIITFGVGRDRARRLQRHFRALAAGEVPITSLGWHPAGNLPHQPLAPASVRTQG